MVKSYFFYALILVSAISVCQSPEIIIEDFEDYNLLSREQVHLHLNKTTIIQGEMLGFSAYVFLKDGKTLSENTTNLYCQIIDNKGDVIKEKLLLITDGIGVGNFMINDLFSSGDYYIKAYTNWMRNFPNENNYFIESLHIIDVSNESLLGKNEISQDLDIEFLPESGHLLSETENIMAVIAKDRLGHGVPNIQLTVLDGQKNIVTEITTDKFGMGRFQLVPKTGNIYTAQYYFNDELIRVPLPIQEQIGVILSVKDDFRRDEIQVILNTNTKTLESIDDMKYLLSVHNGVEIKTFQLNFLDKSQLNVPIKYQDLFDGVNVFTLFDSNLKPVAERMYFNFNESIIYTQPIEITASSTNDSLKLVIDLKNLDTSYYQNLSVSVLPFETKSYAPNNSIISSLYLNPFLNDPAENAGYYFENTDNEKKYQLDNLLITKGWSSYDWTRIFGSEIDDNYNFEVGVSYTINRNSTDPIDLIVYPNINSKSEIISLSEGEASVFRQGFFPLDDEVLKIGGVDKQNQSGLSKLVLQFLPSKINDFNMTLNPISKMRLGQNINALAYESYFRDATELDEVKIFSKRKYTRAERLQEKTLGRITVFDDKMRRNFRTIGNFLSNQGYLISEGPEEDANGNYSVFRIFNRHRTSIRKNQIERPQIFINDALLIDYDLLHNFSMDIVDYININKFGHGEGLRGGFGTIRIYLDASKTFKFEPKVSYSSYKIPLTFSTPKRFYVPKYRSNQTQFYKEYGVINWFPKLRVDENGLLSFKIEDPEQPIRLFIEGVVNGNQLVSKKIKVN